MPQCGIACNAAAVHIECTAVIVDAGGRTIVIFGKTVSRDTAFPKGEGAAVFYTAAAPAFGVGDFADRLLAVGYGKALTLCNFDGIIIIDADAACAGDRFAVKAKVDIRFALPCVANLYIIYQIIVAGFRWEL